MLPTLALLSFSQIALDVSLDNTVSQAWNCRITIGSFKKDLLSGWSMISSHWRSTSRPREEPTVNDFFGFCIVIHNLAHLLTYLRPSRAVPANTKTMHVIRLPNDGITVNTGTDTQADAHTKIAKMLNAFIIG